jgi:hypothetical protein
MRNMAFAIKAEVSDPGAKTAGIKPFDSRGDVKAAFQELRKLGDSLL